MELLFQIPTLLRHIPLDSILPHLDPGQKARLFLLTLRQEEQRLVLLWIRHFNPILDRQRHHLILLRTLLEGRQMPRPLKDQHRHLIRLCLLTLRAEEQRQIQLLMYHHHRTIQSLANNL